MNRKVISYLGFAKKSGNLLAGVNTCAMAMAKGRVRLMILAEDISENGEKKILKEIRRYGVKYRKYGDGETMSHAVGATGRTVFALCDDNFAEVILKEIDREQE